MAVSKYIFNLVFIFLLFSSLTYQSYANFDGAKNSNQPILHLPLQRVNRLATSTNKTLNNKIFQDHMLGAPGTGYVIHIWLGTPPQKVSYILIVDFLWRST